MTTINWADAMAATEGQPLPGDILRASLPPDFVRVLLERWLHENGIEAHEGPWFAQSFIRMERAVDYALGCGEDAVTNNYGADGSGGW